MSEKLDKVLSELTLIEEMIKIQTGVINFMPTTEEVRSGRGFIKYHYIYDTFDAVYDQNQGIIKMLGDIYVTLDEMREEG